MEEKYRLQYFDSGNNKFSIEWVENIKNYVAGDCRVKAIKEETDIIMHNKTHCRKNNYTEPMTLKEIKKYIKKNNKILGKYIHDCVGLKLEDVCKKVEFEKPIKIRNYKKYYEESHKSK